jgi:O-antigen ligase/polysaccharide polymerase Wzy-like membrane protein
MAAAAIGIRRRHRIFEVPDATKFGFFWLSAFFVVYCARPEDWIPGLKFIPLAKITAILAILALFASVGRTKRTFRDIPQEGKILLVMVVLLFVDALLSPVWKGGAISQTIDFSKVLVTWILAFLLITTFDRLRRIIFIQTVSVVVISVVSLIKGRHQPRLEGVIGGIYANPNDLAFAMVLTLPFALAFLITSNSNLKKILWFFGIVTMLAALFLTASRAGFIDLVISGVVIMWHFGVRGKRHMLIAGTALACIVLMVVAGGKLYDRFAALSGNSATEGSAYGSFEERKYLMQRALVGIEHYPVFGIGINNFNSYSGVWREVHMTYLQVCVEGGIPVLILYLMFFWKGFKNLKILRKTQNLDEQTVLFVGALHSSLVGFAVGACFAPEAYQFFPYFAIAFTATLLRTVRETAQSPAAAPFQQRKPKPLSIYADRTVNAGALERDRLRGFRSPKDHS